MGEGLIGNRREAPEPYCYALASVTGSRRACKIAITGESIFGKLPLSKVLLLYRCLLCALRSQT
ncbi:hypothetical protein FOT65_12495 [Citrobacter portucalensis]|nr:hypothetical protein [Citrobacter portucalensis]MBE0033265.1 hypothetical protein [Citrobacter portucalensis]MBE0039396.1 hypothetical protein [Citrobacter portucalensis]MBE0044908.1 hypothetical protein [Citrobacter portucalensis]MBE0076988.1 hypothetical protein [Citrobacter portucalensis]